MQPVAPRERLVSLDVLRGFALYGVLLANLFVLYSLRFADRGEHATTVLDDIAHWFLQLLVESRAQTLLTFLFGLGFAVQLARARARDERAMPVYLRRIAALFAIGWFHVLVLSWVDVTWGYAVTALFLLPFTRVSNRTRLVVAAACTAIPAALYVIPEVWPALEGLLFDRPRPAYIQDYAAAARGGDRLEIARAHATLALLWTFGGGVAWYLPWLLGRFLVGFVAGAQGWFDNDGADHLPLFRKMLLVGGLVTAPYLAFQVLVRLHVFSPNDLLVPFGMLVAIAVAAGLVGQVAMYIAIVVLLVQRPRWRRVLGVIAPIGRMPLTTYLMQSLICTTLFYGWGLGWSTPSPAECVGLGTAIFAAQIAIAHAWLRKFRHGPAEWVWRTIVYWKPQPMRDAL